MLNILCGKRLTDDIALLDGYVCLVGLNPMATSQQTTGREFLKHMILLGAIGNSPQYSTASVHFHSSTAMSLGSFRRNRLQEKLMDQENQMFLQFQNILRKPLFNPSMPQTWLLVCQTIVLQDSMKQSTESKRNAMMERYQKG